MRFFGVLRILYDNRNKFGKFNFTLKYVLFEDHEFGSFLIISEERKGPIL